jgi:hypothetical protein
VNGPGAVPFGQAEVAAVVIRGCDRCGYRRDPGRPCGGCGNTEPAVVHDLGVVAATYSNPVKAAWWRLAGSRLADRRIKRTNRQIAR